MNLLNVNLSQNYYKMEQDNRTNISHPAEPLRVGSLVRWPEFPDRLYFVKRMGIRTCGREDYCHIETIDHKWCAYVPVIELVLDDVDYDEPQTVEAAESDATAKKNVKHITVVKQYDVEFCSKCPYGAVYPDPDPDDWFCDDDERVYCRKLDRDVCSALRPYEVGKIDTVPDCCPLDENTVLNENDNQ